MGRAWTVAGIAHLALFLALGLATAWKTQPQTLQAEAELWSAVPQAAAPPLQTPQPPRPDPKPEPEPPPKPRPVQPTLRPEPDKRLPDPQIAIEKKKKDDLHDKEMAERQRKALEKRKKEAEEKTLQDKLARELASKEKALKEKLSQEKAAQEKKALDKKATAEKTRSEEIKRLEDEAQKAKQDKDDDARANAMRQENLQRMQGMAGATGGPNATGTALKSSGPSASYAGRLVGRIKPNITYPGDVIGNPRAEVEVRVAPDGTITNRRIVQSSGNKAWDDAVLRAIDKTEVLPKDIDGRVPPLLVLGFRPMD